METDSVGSAPTLTVGELARSAGVTVRTLHHYDDIGLVVPQRRGSSGYRLYGRSQIERLQEVLFFRELGIPLAEIAEIVARADYDRVETLRHQHRLLEERAGHLARMIAAVDAAADAAEKGIRVSSEEMLEVFGGFDPSAYRDETKQRWGATDAYKQSAGRTSRYTKQDWETIRAETDDLNRRFLALLTQGTAATSPEAMDVAEDHRSHITKWFYDCSLETHAGLGQMYVSDKRFRDNIDESSPGLATYIAAAIAANASR